MLNNKKDYSHIGILSAMPEEVGIILDNLKNAKSYKFGDFELFSGYINIDSSKEIFVTTAWSGWGKVSAARATTRLLSTDYHLPIDFILFTGVAGGINKRLKQWDVILADSLIQHDMDARPLFDKYVIPSINQKKIYPCHYLLENVFNNLKNNLINDNFSKFGSLYKGLIGTGDMFISNNNKINNLLKEIPELYAVEMEGAAFAQVAFQEKVDWLVMRVISDTANSNASNDFEDFLKEYKLNSFALIKSFLEALKNK